MVDTAAHSGQVCYWRRAGEAVLLSMRTVRVTAQHAPPRVADCRPSAMAARGSVDRREGLPGSATAWKDMFIAVEDWTFAAGLINSHQLYKVLLFSGVLTFAFCRAARLGIPAGSVCRLPAATQNWQAPVTPMSAVAKALQGSSCCAVFHRPCAVSRSALYNIPHDVYVTNSLCKNAQSVQV